MKSFRVICGLTLTLLSVISTGEASDKWIHATTAHFDMYSSASEEESREFLNQLEQFRSALHQIFHLSSTGEAPVTITMFVSDREFEAYKPMHNGKTKSIVGQYIHGVDKDIIELSAEAQRRGDTGDNVIFHEYVHKVLRDCGLKLPTWLDEGLAVFYATMRVGKDFAEIGQPDRQRLKHAGRAALMPLAKLLSVNHASPEYNEGPLMADFYAESWLLVHYLVCGTEKNFQGGFSLFVENETAGTQEDKFKRAFGLTYSQMEAELHDYLHGGHFMTRIYKLPIGDFSNEIQFEPAGEIERETVLEDLRWRVRPEEANPTRLLQLAESDPKAARPYEALAAQAIQREHDRQKAGTYWAQAAERGSTNAFVYLQLATTILSDDLSKASLDYRLPAAERDLARKYLDRAVALRPDYVAAWELLAHVEAFSEDPRSSVIDRVLTVFPSMRSKGDTLAALAVVYWRWGNFVSCRRILDEVARAKPGPKAKNLVVLLEKEISNLEGEKAKPTATFPKGEPEAR